MLKIAIIMGSESDKPVMEEAAKMCAELGLASEMIVASAHRSPEKVAAFATSALGKYEAIIAGAGKAAHLPGVIAGQTILPVIGVPMKTSDLGGMDSLLSIVQMPAGVPVATVAINGAKNAAILAAQIVARYDKNVCDKLTAYKQGLA